MEAVGQLAAGIAHDFNNLLTVVQTYTSFVLDEAELSGEHRSGLGQVRAAADRAAALTRQLLVFSRRQLTHSAPLSICTVFQNLRGMLERLLPAGIATEWDCDDDLPRVHADQANLEQVIMNLVVNARDAMPRGGHIRLHLDERRFTEADHPAHPESRPGRFVHLSVADDGHGIPPENLARIFEPFFTTKQVGQGTGLGLSTVYAIVHQHEGWIEVASTPGEGTTFHLFFPAINEAPATSGPGAQPYPSSDKLHGAGESILLVEDEIGIRLVARAVLQRAGYHVVDAADGPAALEAWSAAEAPFDLLLTDMVMPNGLTGADLATDLRRRHPSLRVILMTGYSEDLLRENRGAVPGSHILLKPFTRATLLAAIRETLGPD